MESAPRNEVVNIPVFRLRDKSFQQSHRFGGARQERIFVVLHILGKKANSIRLKIHLVSFQCEYLTASETKIQSKRQRVPHVFG